jgi:hypothetical protein
MKKSNLYYDLRNTEQLNEYLEGTIANFNNYFRKYEGLPGFSHPPHHISSEEIGFIDIPELQRQIIKKELQKEEKNLILEDAVNGKRSVKKTLEELSKINEGYKRWLPRRKNDEHNIMIDYMSNLIGDDYLDLLKSLKANGTGHIDNPFTYGAYGLLGGELMYGALLVIEAFAPLTETSLDELGIFAWIVGLSGLVLASFGMVLRQPNDKNLLKRAEYIDRKIEELL